MFDQLGKLTDLGETSQMASDSGEAAIAVYDSFRLWTDTEISAMTWEGLYCLPVADGPRPIPTATAFVVTWVADGDDGPDLSEVLSQQTVTSADVLQVLQTSGRQACGATDAAIDYYRYETELAEPLEIEARETYWLSIQAVTPDFSTYWAWRGAEDADRASIRAFDRQTLDIFGDRAFGLIGTPAE